MPLLLDPFPTFVQAFPTITNHPYKKIVVSLLLLSSVLLIAWCCLCFLVLLVIVLSDGSVEAADSGADAADPTANDTPYLCQQHQ